ncbi:MAG: thioesterase family protein [Steroidobacteraceae bacterium]
MSSVYRVDNETAFTKDCAAGPWDPGLQHGGAPASLISWAAERMPTREPMQVVRMTIDLLRPVPIAPLRIQTEVLREGRKIQLCAVTLWHEQVAVVRATVLKVRAAEVQLPDHVREEKVLLPGPDAGHEPEGLLGDTKNAFIKGLDLRVVKGAFRSPGPAAIWFRAHRTIVEGEPISALMRAAMTGDFCNGTSAVLDFQEWTFINADVTISLARMPVGEWILLDAETWLGATGAGIAFAKLGDERGYFGRAIQSLVIEPR